MNIKDIVNTYVCPMASLPRFDSLVSNTSVTARDVMAAMRMAGEEIAKRAEWTRMVKSATVSSGESLYELPTDFHRLIQGNAVQLLTTPYTPVLVISSNNLFSMVSLLNSTQPYCAVRNGSIIFEPSLTANATVRYITKNWLEDDDDVELDVPSADANTVVFPDQLLGLGTLWRYKRSKGLGFADIKQDFDDLLEIEIKADRGVV